jgi:radical SAM protein with 4Fe4S-binding SPASM domain
MDPALLDRVDCFVASTRPAVFVREADQLLLIRPDKTLGLNPTAVALLSALYDRARRPAGEVLSELAPRLGAPPERLLADTVQLVETVGALLNEDFRPRPGLRFTTFDRTRVRYPTLAEIALTYACQNRCRFCYASSPYRREERRMTTAQVERVMERIFHEAHVPSLSFTGGEATLAPDLPELVRFGADLGLRVNLITNGIRAADPAYAATLAEAGLASAQVSLEAADATLHDRLVGRDGAFAHTVQGIRNFKHLGLHVHTNATLGPANLDAAADLVRFVASDLGLRTLSMNMVIRTGVARGAAEEQITYSEVAARIPGLVEVARQEGVRLVWYSPIPYCIFNPVLHGLGAKSCACVDAILSVDPSGQLLPCSSFAGGLGSLLERTFAEIWRSPQAMYWRRKEFLPPPCRGCADADVCGGGCPLYWDAVGSFAELPRPQATSRHERRWLRRRRRGGAYGVPAPGQEVAWPA